ncbi:MAG: ribose-phosphate diphosphokinase [Methanobacteriota archaeon]|nr:MAG: ribose-phosphate diphosphokinase [Euryarchaeota archaeon]
MRTDDVPSTDSMQVVGGSASRSLAKELAGQLGAGLAHVEVARFPDDECYLRIEGDLAGEEVVIVQTTCPDRNIIELLLLQDAVADLGMASVTTVAPYFGYARQDKKFNEGEPVSARALARAISATTDRFLTVDVHAASVMSWFEGVDAHNVSGHAEIGGFLREQGAELVLSPDEGRRDNAEHVAEVVGCDSDFLVKERLNGETVMMTPKSLDVSGRKVAIVDDIISTGGTIVRAAEQLRNQGANEITAVCTHGVFAGGAIAKLRAVCDEVYSTDTIENPTTAMTVASQIARTIQER